MYYCKKFSNYKQMLNQDQLQGSQIEVGWGGIWNF